MRDIEPRPYANILRDTYCPEDQNVGCQSCCSDMECCIRIHDEEKCGELELFGEDCEICRKEHDKGDRDDWLYECEKDRLMMEGE
jgi:hypothetical protein